MQLDAHVLANFIPAPSPTPCRMQFRVPVSTCSPIESARARQMAWREAYRGHVMAHEIAHILKGVSRHSADGVMKAQWDDHNRREMTYGRFRSPQ